MQCNYTGDFRKIKMLNFFDKKNGQITQHSDYARREQSFSQALPNASIFKKSSYTNGRLWHQLQVGDKMLIKLP